ncbi:MAG TPA: energy-coupling factor transporter transmembrane component T [Thermomicrobiales bacterium]|nr:energy-coupling factor transporter transmembrane component T [Thermomicrobiales bacterium]
MTDGSLDSRTWLLWGLAAILPLLVARNPWVVLAVLICVLIVRRAWAAHHRAGWGWIVRLAVLFMAVGVVFNALTVHSGNQVLFTIPAWVPLAGGRVTMNAVVYGIVSGVAIVSLVLAGTTVAAGLVWSDLMRFLPARIAPLAVAGSVAWSFLPGASRTFQEIRESQAMRGHRLRGVRDMLPLVVPLLGGALDQAITMSEALESRGFGASDDERDSRPIARVALVVAISAFLLVGYTVAVGQVRMALVAGVTGVVFAVGGLRGAGSGRRTTRYRPSHWSDADRLVMVFSLASAFIFFWRSRVHPDAAIFNPYPNLSVPKLDLLMLAGLALLVTPALLVPARPEGV